MEDTGAQTLSIIPDILLYSRCCVVDAGGIAEMYILEEHAETVKIKDRKGFVRIAVEKGVPIVPVYHFGNSQLFRWGPKSWEKAARKWRMAVGFIRGRWNLPLPEQ